MKRFRFCAIFLLTALLMSLFAPAAAALSDPQADSSHAVVLVAERGDSETVLYTKNETERLMPASLTKVMTVLLALEAVEDGTKKLSDMVTASDRLYYDISGDSSSVYMAIGETMTLENLLYCAMLNSANEACNVIAEYIGGTIENFIEMMNARAVALGCKDTHFTNTHGMPDPDHYTTAWDFSRILREAARSDVFMEIANTVTYVVPDTNASAERKLENTNSLINPTNPLYPGDYGYEYARGVKTGHTSDAGYCLASLSARRRDLVLRTFRRRENAVQLGFRQLQLSGDRKIDRDRRRGRCGDGRGRRNRGGQAQHLHHGASAQRHIGRRVRAEGHHLPHRQRGRHHAHGPGKRGTDRRRDQREPERGDLRHVPAGDQHLRGSVAGILHEG